MCACDVCVCPCMLVLCSCPFGLRRVPIWHVCVCPFGMCVVCPFGMCACAHLACVECAHAACVECAPLHACPSWFPVASFRRAHGGCRSVSPAPVPEDSSFVSRGLFRCLIAAAVRAPLFVRAAQLIQRLSRHVARRDVLVAGSLFVHDRLLSRPSASAAGSPSSARRSLWMWVCMMSVFSSSPAGGMPVLISTAALSALSFSISP